MRTTNRKCFLKILLPGTAAALVLMACGSSGATSTPPVRATTGATPTAGAATAVAPTSPALPTATRAPVATSAPSPTATPAPTSSGELVVALAVLSDIGMSPASGSGVRDAHEALYTYPIGTKTSGELEPQSGLITSWTANVDSSAWTFKVRDNLIFHNGTRATAADASFTLLTANDKDAKFARNDLQKSYTKIETPDDSTMVVTLAAPDIFWHINYLSRTPPLPTSSPKLLFSKAYVSNVGLVEQNKNPVGSGPYKFKSAITNDRVVLEAVERHFYFGVPRTKTVSFIGIPEESTRLALILNKTADLTKIDVISNLKSAKQAGLGITTRQGGSLPLLWNSQYPATFAATGPNPFANENVRKAVFWYGIDRKAIVDSFLGGEGKPSMEYPIMSWDVGAFQPFPVPTYDLAKAKGMLAEAGLSKGFDLDFYVGQDNPVTTEYLEAIAVYWEQLGLKVNRIPYKGTVFSQALTNTYNKGGFAKPTVGPSNAPNRNLSAQLALLQSDPAGIFHVNDYPEGLRLAKEYAAVKSMAEYKQKGEAYRQWAYQHAATFVPLFEINEVYVRTSKVSTGWELDRNPPNIRVDYAAALR